MKGNSMSAEANVGVVGLAAMGGSLARNLAHHGNKVAVFNRTYARTEKLMNEHGGEGEFYPAKTLEEFVDSLVKPRTAIIMVKAGEPTDAMINALADLMEPGDIIVDAGNAYFPDTIRREKEISARGLHFVGCGVSGGEEGALLGPSMMPGGSEESWKTLKPIFESIAAKAEGEPCVTHIGLNGAGHFVKMVHNGIEYSDMQLIAESYDLMRRGLGMTPAEIGDVFEEWNKTELDSYLIEITAEVLHQVDKKTGKPLVDLIVDHAGMKGTGTWTVQTALSLAVPVTGIAEAVFARGLSSEADLREEAQKQGFAGPDGKLNLNDDEKKAFIEDIRQALYASKIVAYAQASTRSPPPPRNTAGTSTSPPWHASGVAAASSARSSSTAFPKRSNPARPTCHCCSPRTSRTPSKTPRSPGATWSPRPPSTVCRPRRSPRRCPTSTACVPSVCRPPSSRASATTSAPTPTSAWTSRARSTPCGPSRAAKRSKPDLFLASVSGRICQRSCDVFHCKTSGICILLSCDIVVPLH